MSQYDFRNAPQDTALQQVIPTENIDVAKPGRFYPEEYSGEIQAISKKQGMLAEIPKTLASITEHFDDYRISLWHDEQQTAINKDKMQIQNKLTLREQEQQQIISNSVYDMSKQMDAAVIDAIKQADIDKRSRTDALLEVYDQFANPEDFENSPAAKKLWQQTLQNSALEGLNAARQYDVNTQQYLNKANIADAISTINAEILQGNLDETSAMKKALVKITPLLQQLPGIEVQQIVNGAWDQFVMAKAENIIFRHDIGLVSDDDATTQLLGLLRSNARKEFIALDEHEEEIKDKNGQTVMFDLQLSPATQEKLLRAFKSTKGSGSGDSAIFDFTSDFDKYIGYKEYLDTGFSSAVLGKTREELSSFYEQQKARLINSSMSDTKKAEAYSTISEHYAQVMAIKDICEMSKLYKAELGPKLQSLITNLENDINGAYKGDWTDYKLETEINGVKQTIAIGNTLLANPDAVRLGDHSKASELYWRESLKQLKTVSNKLANGSVGEVLSYIDNDYKETQVNIIGAINKNSLEKGVSVQQGNSTVQMSGEEYISTQIQQADLAAQKAGFGKPQMAGSTLDAIFTGLHDPSRFETTYDTFKGTQVVMKALAEAGHLSDFSKYMIRNGANNTYAKNAMFTFCFKNLTDAALKNDFEELERTVVSDTDALKQAQEELNNKGLGRQFVSQIEKEVYDRLNVPLNHRNWYSTASNRAALLAARKGTGQKGYEEYLKKLVKNNYIELKGVKNLNGSILKYSSQMALYNTPEKQEQLVNRLNGTFDTITKYSKQLGIEKELGKMQWVSDDENGIFRLSNSVDGTGFEITGQGQTAYLGTLPVSEDLLKVHDHIVTDLSSYAFISSMVATNNSLLKDIGNKESIARDSLALSATLNNSNTFNKIAKETEQDIYGVNIRAAGSFNVIKQDIPSNTLINALLVRENPDFYTDPIAKQVILNKKEKENKVLNKHIEQEVFKKTIQRAIGETSYIGKINQNNISNLVSQAAVGNEKQIDIYNTTQAAGYKASSSEIPGVTPGEEEGVPTGFAANITGSISTVPTATGIKHSKDEINQMVNHYANMFGIPQTIAHALVMQESGGKQTITSKAGAQGLTQLMPATAKGLGVKDPNDAAQNIWGGMKYLNAQYKRFGSWPLALAAYNAGPGAVAKAKGIPNFKETKNYVRSICSKAGIDITGKTYPFNIPIKGNEAKLIDADTNTLSINGLNKFVDMINKTDSYKNNVVHIKTNRPELLENKPEYTDYTQYRNLKNKDGSPLFVKGDFDGFSIILNRDTTDGKLNPAAIPALADSVFNTQTDVVEKLDRDGIEALLTTFADRYSDRPRFEETDIFGLSNLTAREYEEYGIPATLMNNPELQARVLVQEFQRAKDILGNERKAIFALAGGKMVDQDGIIKSWAEIKQDRNNFIKSWFIQPSDNATDRNEINTIVARYNAECKKLRGI